jgi:hypothetical protein
MAADDDDNEVDGNGATGDDDGYVSYDKIVKLIILLICLHYSFTAEGCYRRESERREGHGSRRDAGERSRGRGGFLSGVL